MSEKKVAAVVDPGRDSQMIEVAPATDLLAISKAEIDVQIATAKQFPRDFKQFVDGCFRMATYTREAAETMHYRLPRKTKDGETKFIEGPSVRFAEIVGQNWRNCRIGARVLGADEKNVISQGVFHDLESNVAISFEIKRRITDKTGRRYSDDMIGTTGAAAAGIAFRNAVLKGVPKMFWLPMYEKALEVARGDEKDVVPRRKIALEEFAKMGVPEAAVLATLEVKSVAKIGADELLILRGIYNAIKEGTTTAAEAFNIGPKPLAPTEDLSAQLQESIEDVAARKANVAKKNKPVEKSPQSQKSDVPKASVPPESKIDDPYLTPKQQADIFNWAMQAGWKVPEELTAWIKKNLKVNSIREVRNSQYTALMRQAKGEAR